MKNPIYFISLFLLCLFSCDDRSNNRAASFDDTVLGKRPDSIKDVITLETFSDLPTGIGGCGEYLAYDNANYEDKQLIFVSDLKGFAIIRVGGKDIRLQHVSSQNHNDTSYKSVYSSGGQTAALTLTKTTAYDEGGFYKGTLVLTGDIINARIGVHGESGC